jgi:hypothetical protein
MTIGDMVEIGSYDLHSLFSRVANFAGGGRLVTLGTQALDDGPLNIVIHTLPEGLTRLEVGIDTLVLHGRDVRSWKRGGGTTYDSEITDFEPGDSAVQRIKENSATLRDFLCQRAHSSSLRFLWMKEALRFGGGPFNDAVAQRIWAGAQALRAGQWIEGTRSLRGVGIGLTPTGDDFLVGVMFGLHVAARATGTDAQSVVDLMGDEALRGEPIRSEPIIKAMYRMARRARAFRSLKNLLAAIVWHGAEEVVSCAQSVFSVGETSGTDLVTGLVWAIEKGGCGWRLKRA